MTLIASGFNPPWYLRNKHVQTILPALLRNGKEVHFHRERIIGVDGDFLDLDWLRNTSDRVALVVHGLEASTRSPYICGMANALQQDGWNVAAMNLRGVTHEHHEIRKTYHSGATEDIHEVVNHLLSHYHFNYLVLVGFSLGGNLVIKYAGERSSGIDTRIRKAVAISVPCDLKSSAFLLDSPSRSIYGKRFLRSLKKKLYGIHHRLPFKLSEREVRKIKTLVQYDDCFTAPMYGFMNAADYYEKSSSKKFIAGVQIPLLILTAADDPFLTPESLPYDECKNHPWVVLEVSRNGGHVGFMMNHPWGKYYSELRTLEFLSATGPS